MTGETAPFGALDILILSDGRPGHYHLSEGVAAAIARRRSVNIRRIDVHRPRWLPGRVLARLLGSGDRLTPILGRILGLPAALPQAGLVISAGGETAAANIVASRKLRAVNVFCGTLRRLPAEQYALVVSSYARHADRPRHLVCLKPNGIDPDTLGTTRRRAGPSGKPPEVAGLLIGGDSGFFTYEAGEWRRLVEFLETSHKAHGTRWIVSTSRRSPDFIGDVIAKLARLDDSPVQSFIDFRTAGPGTLPRLFASADAILCTEDSSTMLSEAVCARLPVVGVSPRQHGFKDEEAEYRAFMREQGWCRFLPIAGLSPGTFAAALAEVRPLEENHLDRLAQSLAERLPALFAAGG